MSQAIKHTTGLTGLNIHQYPRRTLAILYGKIIRVLQKFPTDYSYRQYTEILVKEKADIVNQIESVAEIEKKIDCGQIEELILQADKELKLVRNFLDWKPWEPLLNKNFANQWSWPPHA
ncbi:NADH dehydrogenase [ubiquinone] 1 alpha subcomplex subunit 5 [Nasonia vitripennis]|uniref:NADH dehydrogenase [ubiquinone] 1 alpha subcomplex subunit 5 n=1 Tax=Nasonia vitripennis TaxID=7425 RepID=A0A7M6W8F8_NASVI|nr:NADH dehydrogenase [ubiquinone] 1 alpha subcomplex subunit 5 [Nasonia vitripennis]